MFSLFGKKDKTEKAEPSLLERLKASVTKTKTALAETVDSIFLGERTIDPSILKNLETALISADIGVKTTREVLDAVKEKLDRNALSNAAQLKQEIKSHISRIVQPATEMKLGTASTNGSGPRVVFVVGVNGVGKTTSIGKLANRLRQQGLNVVLCAADTFRAAAIEQLEIWAQRNGVEVVKQKSGADPAAVVFDAMAAAKSRNADAVIVDTAGRRRTTLTILWQIGRKNRPAPRNYPRHP